MNLGPSVPHRKLSMWGRRGDVPLRMSSITLSTEWTKRVTSLDNFRLFFVGVGSSSNGFLILRLFLTLEDSVSVGIKETSFLGVLLAVMDMGNAEVSAGNPYGTGSNVGTLKAREGWGHTEGVKRGSFLRTRRVSRTVWSGPSLKVPLPCSSASSRSRLRFWEVLHSWKTDWVFSSSTKNSEVSPFATSLSRLRSTFLCPLNQFWNNVRST